MKRALRALCCAPFAVYGAAVLAVPPEHGPFSSDENRTLPLAVCETSRAISLDANWSGTVEFRSGDEQLSLTLADFGIREARTTGGADAAVPLAFDVAAPNDVGDEAVCADLNGDGRTDFVVTFWQHGNGLGAEFYRRIVALSSDDGYRYWSLETMMPSAEDFVTVGSRARAMITTSFVQSGSTDEPGPDRRHSYYAYDLWTFRGGDVVSANATDGRFPKYVLMTYAPNHKPSVRMSRNRPAVAGPLPRLLWPEP